MFKKNFWCCKVNCVFVVVFVLSLNSTGQPQKKAIKMEASVGSDHSESKSQSKIFQDGNPRIDKAFPTELRVGSLTRLQRCLLPYIYKPEVKKVTQVPLLRTDLLVQGSAI